MVSTFLRHQPARVLSLFLGFDVRADSAAQISHALVDDAVENLNAFAPAPQHARFVERVEVLRHIGLGGFDVAEQVAHVLLAIAQATQNLESHRCGQNLE